MKKVRGEVDVFVKRKDTQAMITNPVPQNMSMMLEFFRVRLRIQSPETRSQVSRPINRNKLINIILPGRR
jgi:hypothetical protein